MHQLAAMAPQERGRGHQRHAGHHLEDVGHALGRMGNQMQQELAGTDRDDQTPQQVDREHRGRELHRLFASVAPSREVEGGRDRGGVQRVGESDRYDEDRHAKHRANCSLNRPAAGV